MIIKLETRSGPITVSIADYKPLKALARRCVYTANFNGYSNIAHFPNLKKILERKNILFIVFTDQDLDNEYASLIVKANVCAPNPRYAAKVFKVLSHRFLSNCDTSIWIDANIDISGDISHIIEKFEQQRCPLSVFEHDKRNHLIEEAEACSRLAKDCSTVIQKQVEQYRSIDTESLGLYQGRIIIRKPCSVIVSFEELWWNEIAKYSIRDQISLPVAIYSSGASVMVMRKEQRDTTFTVLDHAKYSNYAITTNMKDKAKGIYIMSVYYISKKLRSIKRYLYKSTAQTLK